MAESGKPANGLQAYRGELDMKPSTGHTYMYMYFHLQVLYMFINSYMYMYLVLLTGPSTNQKSQNWSHDCALNRLRWRSSYCIIRNTVYTANVQWILKRASLERTKVTSLAAQSFKQTDTRDLLALWLFRKGSDWTTAPQSPFLGFSPYMWVAAA